MNREGMIWTYRAVFTQANAAGGTVKLTFIFPEISTVLYGIVGRDNYGAARAIYADVVDSAGNTVGRIMITTSIDNWFEPILDGGTMALFTTEKTLTLNQRLLIDGDRLVVVAESLVQNETLTISIHALIKTTRPTVVTTGSGGTVTSVVTYNKVI